MDNHPFWESLLRAPLMRSSESGLDGVTGTRVKGRLGIALAAVCVACGARTGLRVGSDADSATPSNDAGVDVVLTDAVREPPVEEADVALPIDGPYDAPSEWEPPGDSWLISVRPEQGGGFSGVAVTEVGFAAVGWHSSAGRDQDVWLTMFGEDGSVRWQSAFPLDGVDFPSAIVETADGVVIAAYTPARAGLGGENAWILRLDNGGQVVWSKLFGGGQNERPYALTKTTRGVAFAGFTTSFGSQEHVSMWVVHLDETGNPLWQKRVTASVGCGGSALTATRDGGLVVAGWYGAEEHSAPWIVKFDAKGDLVWQKTLQGLHYHASSVFEDAVGNLVLGGRTEFPGASGLRDGWVASLDQQGAFRWIRTVGHLGEDEVDGLVPAPDGGYVLAGISVVPEAEAQMWVLGLSPDGKIAWQTEFGGPRDERVLSLALSRQGSPVLAGYSHSFVPNRGGTLRGDAWIAKLSSDGLFHPECSLAREGTAEVATPSVVISETNEIAIQTDAVPVDIYVEPEPMHLDSNQICP